MYVSRTFSSSILHMLRLIDECHVKHPFFPLDDQAILAIEAFLCVVLIQTHGVTFERENTIQFYVTICFVEITALEFISY